MKKLLTSIVSGLLFITACTQFEEPIKIFNDDGQDASATRSSTLNENPYSLQNIQQAYYDLSAQLDLPVITLNATHHYVRFLVQDTLHYRILHDSLGLELIEYPLDRQLAEAEKHRLMNDTLNHWRYTAVPRGFVYPTEVEYEFLDSIYMQSEFDPTIGYAPGSEPQLDQGIYDNIIEQAMINNGIESAPQTRGSTWYPSATIKFEDDYDGNKDGIYDKTTPIPLEGVKVRCVNFVNVGSGYTNAAGYVGNIKGWAGKFMGSVDYSIHWENSIWDIRDGRLWQAKTGGPEKRKQWDLVIKYSEMRKASYFAAIHRALHHYFYKDYLLTQGLRRLDGRTSGLGELKVGTEWTENDTARFNPVPGMFWGNEIVLWARENDIDKDRWYAMSSVFHELGHASHYAVNGIIMGFVGDRIRETWAQGVEYAFMESLYPGFGDRNIMNYDGTYTALVESLLNQGLTLGQVQNTMGVADRWSEWRNNVKTYTSIPDDIIDIIFDNPIWPMKNVNEIVTGAASVPIGVNSEYRSWIFRDWDTLPAGATFDGWTVTGTGVTPADFSAVNLAHRDLNIRFLSKKRFTLTANFTLQNGSRLSDTMVVEPIDVEISISGTDQPMQYYRRYYSVTPEYIPETGHRFETFEVSGNSNHYEVSTDNFSTLLKGANIGFSSPAGTRHTISARYRDDSGNTFIGQTMTVTVQPFEAPTPEAYHYILNDQPDDQPIAPLSSPFSSPPGQIIPPGGGGTVPPSIPGNVVIAPGIPTINLNPGEVLKPWVWIIGWVSSNIMPAVELEYQWKVNGNDRGNSAPWDSENVYLPKFVGTLEVQCRTQYGSKISPWSNMIVVEGGGSSLLETPVITSDKSTAERGATVTFTVTNSTISAYEWERNGVVVSDANGTTYSTGAWGVSASGFSMPSGYGMMSVRCRARAGLAFSEWSEPVTVHVGFTGSIWGGGSSDTVISNPGGGGSPGAGGGNTWQP